MLWGLLVLLPEPPALEPDRRHGAPTPVWEPLRYSYFPVCESPSQRLLDYIRKASILPCCGGFFFYLWMSSISFRGFQSLFVKGCPAVSCDSGVFMRGGVPTSFFAILSPVHYLCSTQSWVMFLKCSTAARGFHMKPPLQTGGCNAVRVMFLDLLSESNYSRAWLVKSGLFSTQVSHTEFASRGVCLFLTRTSVSFDLYAKSRLPPEFIFWSPNTQNDCT